MVWEILENRGVSERKIVDVRKKYTIQDLSE